MRPSRHPTGSRLFSVSPIRDGMPWGVLVHDLDMRYIDDKDLRAELYDLWVENGLIVFKTIGTKETCIKLSKIFGEIIPHPAADLRLKGYEELISVSYSPETGALYEVDGEIIGSFIPWHKDLMYVDRICRGGMLLPIAMPTHLGQTGFIDCIAAYERLPQNLKDTIENLHVVYKFDLDVEMQTFGKLHDARIIRYSPELAKVQDKIRNNAYPPVIHPMVFEQPETGRKVLNVSPVASAGIFEMPGETGDRLLEDVMRHALDTRFHYFHNYEMGDLVLWDNWRMLHSSVGTPPDQKRTIVRTTIVGDYGLGRLHPDAAPPAHPTPADMI